MYISAEESASQIKLRAERLGIKSNNLYIYPQTNFELIKKHIEEMQPDLVIVDSIQAIYTSTIQSSAGSVSQIRECCNALMGIAKTNNISIIVIGHVTKEGILPVLKFLNTWLIQLFNLKETSIKPIEFYAQLKTVLGILLKLGFLR